MSEGTLLSMDVENLLIKYKSRKWDELKLETEFPNHLIREDALALLEKFCTVVYFPIENDGNHGFHITDIPFKSGDRKNFVFINTGQTIEKQVFTAAHELGHIWQVDKYVINELHLQSDEETVEKIISRFAATLLMPEDDFRIVFHSQFIELSQEDGTITITNILKLLVALMNHFFVPIKAVVLRCVELDIFEEEVANILLGKHETLLSWEIIDAKIQEIISEMGYVRFQNPTRRRWIDGLAERLDIAEKSQSVSQDKINALRDKFEIKPKKDIREMNEVVSIGTGKGNDA